MGRLRREVGIPGHIKSPFAESPRRGAALGADAFVTNEVTGLTPSPSSANRDEV